MPLQVEILYNEYRFAAAFAVASLLALLALATLVARAVLEWLANREGGDEPTVATGRDVLA
jgi:sulfate transport system permease protein